MVDDSYESNGYDRGDDENGDPEVPILPDGIAQSVGDNSSKEKTHRAGEFVGRTFTSEKGIWLWRKIIANGGFWTATATVAIAVTSFYQWQAIKRQWEEMKKQSTISSDTEHRQLRAYLLPDTQQLRFPPTGAVTASMFRSRTSDRPRPTP
jgi:hypothetical protein